MSAYAESKLQTEQCCAAWCGKTETPLGIIRLTQVFGPGDRTHKFIPTVVQKVRTDEPVQVFGDGEDRRDYLYIEDGAAILADMTERCYQGLINGVTGRSVSLNEVLAALEAVAGRPVRVERQPRAKERIDRSFDATLLFQSLGVRPFTPLQEALGLTLAAP